MAFDITKWEICKTVTYKSEEYRVLDNTDSGLLLVAKENDVKKEEYPLQVFVIPDSL